MFPQGAGETAGLPLAGTASRGPGGLYGSEGQQLRGGGRRRGRRRNGAASKGPLLVQPPLGALAHTRVAPPGAIGGKARAGVCSGCTGTGAGGAGGFPSRVGGMRGAALATGGPGARPAQGPDGAAHLLPGGRWVFAPQNSPLAHTYTPRTRSARGPSGRLLLAARASRGERPVAAQPVLWRGGNPARGLRGAEAATCRRGGEGGRPGRPARVRGEERRGEGRGGEGKGREGEAAGDGSRRRFVTRREPPGSRRVGLSPPAPRSAVSGALGDKRDRPPFLPPRQMSPDPRRSLHARPGWSGRLLSSRDLLSPFSFKQKRS